MTTGPVSSIGVLGGGQLAAMLIEAANRLDIDVHVFRENSASGRCPTNRTTTRPLDDVDALEAFAADVDVVTVETENIPISTLEIVERFTPVHPSPNVVAISQDRLLEKDFLSSLGIASSPYVSVDSESELRTAISKIRAPGILKTRRLGYDGKGQTRVEGENDVDRAWRAHGPVPSILEEVVDFDCELSVIAARTRSGEFAVYEPGLNVHREGILRTTTVPSMLASDITERACSIAGTILDAHEYVGVMGVEFFVVGAELLVNECAPRVHNSGHWTQEGCAVDQFEQHVRAISALPLGSTRRHCDVVMTNIIGAEADDVNPLLHEDGLRLHLYGKGETRPGRKMGHVNRVHPLTT